MKEADQLRAWLEGDSGGRTIIGGVGCTGDTLLAVLDRLDELEWIVAVMRGKVQPDPDTAWLARPSGEVGD